MHFLRPHPENSRLPAYKRLHLWQKITVYSVLTIAVLLIAGRIYLPYWVKDYANKTLNNIEGYRGSVADIDIALYRGAYTIHGLELFKIDKNIPAPFIDIRSIDLSLQWGALFKGSVVGDVTLNRPVINFATSKTGATAQTGTDTDWTKPIKDLMPLDINWIEINNGRISYQDFSASPKVDLFVDDLELRATNLRNADDKNVPFPSDITARGNSIGQGKLAIDGKVNILKEIPDMDITSKLESVNMPALNDYARSFAGIDFAKGNLDIYTDLLVKDGKVTGFIKPLAKNIELIDYNDPEFNPVGYLWESFVSVVLEIFSNQSKDQFATQIRLEGNIDNPETNVWSTLGGIFRNAFIKGFSNDVKPE